MALLQAVSTAAFVARPHGVPRFAAAVSTTPPIEECANTATPNRKRRRGWWLSTIGSSSNGSSSGSDEMNDEEATTMTATARSSKTPIRFLGKGVDAIVREGAVLLAPSHEFHHFYRRAAIFIYSIGTDTTTAATTASVRPGDDGDEETLYIRGLILDHPTAFTINDVLGGVDDRFVSTAFGETNLVHRGGDKGGDGLILLHDVKNIAATFADASAVYDDDDDDDMMMIGNSGLYQGGWDRIIPACEAGVADVNNFKAFFNHCEFTERELEDLLKSDEDGDNWISIEVLDCRLLLSQQWQRGDLWRRLRNAVMRDYGLITTTTAMAATAAPPPPPETTT
jgi:hypothetical protein